MPKTERRMPVRKFRLISETKIDRNPQLFSIHYSFGPPICILPKEVILLILFIHLKVLPVAGYH